MGGSRIEANREFLALALSKKNAEATPRPGQIALIDGMAAASAISGGQMTGIAPTGSGKSMAALSHAAVGAINFGERWVISTEGVALQTQYLDEGAFISQASEAAGKKVSVEILKGWAQYVCAAKSLLSAVGMGARDHTGPQASTRIDPKTVSADDSSYTSVRLSNLAAEILKVPDEVITQKGDVVDIKETKKVVMWGLNQHCSPESSGEKTNYPEKASDEDWELVTISKDECLTTECSLRAVCKPNRARDRAGKADIIITNHTMLGIQASKSAALVLGSAKLGEFNGIIVDEAHQLPSKVRSQGKATIDRKRIARVRKSVHSSLQSKGLSKAHEDWAAAGDHLATLIDIEIVKGVGTSGKRWIDLDGSDPFSEHGDALEKWLEDALSHLEGMGTADLSSTDLVARKIARNAVERLGEEIQGIRNADPSMASWLTLPQHTDTGGTSPGTANSSPVFVGQAISKNLWHSPAGKSEDVEAKPRPMSVICISATLPEGFEKEVGLRPRGVIQFPSPLMEAHKNSMIFIPMAATARDLSELRSDPKKVGSRAFDTKLHSAWAGKLMLELVLANGGSALVLSATRDGAIYYADLLRSCRREFKVFSQFDGEGSTIITNEWKKDISSVLVGTKKFMTGLDAPGETCSLVILDRPPRSPMNAVDNARVRLANKEPGRTLSGDTSVYVGGATVDAEQAGGRLIRTETDTGLFAILDPRLSDDPTAQFSYRGDALSVYRAAFSRFGLSSNTIGSATSFLRARKNL